MLVLISGLTKMLKDPDVLLAEKVIKKGMRDNYADEFIAAMHPLAPFSL